MFKLNKTQQQAVEYTKGPLIIVAGAGTGKTMVITQKIAYLIQKKLAKPEEILALVFNDKAAEEIATRVDAALSLGYVDLQISTFHAFCQRILEQHGLEIGLSSQFKILTQNDAWILVKQNLDKFNLDYYRPLGNPTKHIHELIKHFSKCKDELISPQEYLEYAENLELAKDNKNIEDKNRLTEIANAYHVYNQLLLDNNVLDFGDLILCTVKLLEKRQNILKQLQNRFKYILVDEFQDVNWAQYQLVRLLADKDSQLTVVGDDDQSIYAFRGVSVANIMRFKDDYPLAKEIVLTENYRSGQKILDQAYECIQNNNPDRLESKLKVDKKLKSTNKDTGEVVWVHKPTFGEEVEHVVKEIIKLKKHDKQTIWDDFAILVRANSHATPFINAFESAGIPYEFLAASGLYHQPVVIDCLNFFKLIDNYHESTAIFRLLCLSFFSLKESDLQKITYNSYKKSISYYETLKRAGEFGLSSEGMTVSDKLITLIHQGMRSARQNKPSQVLYEFLDQSGYLKYLTHEETSGNRTAIRQIYQLTQFLEYIKKYEEVVVGARVADFLRHYNDLVNSGDDGAMRQPTDTPDSVNILTIHRAKGLEFKYVFVVNLVEDRFPARNRGNGIDIPLELIREQLPEGDSHWQEERRLFYVACTRAKTRLYLTSASDYGGARTKKISRFLTEIGYQMNMGIEVKQKTMIIQPNKIEAKTGSFIYQPPTVFSFSQIKSYNTCPYQYKLGNIFNLPPKQSHYFSFGNTMHHTLHEFYKRIQLLNSAQQISLFGLPAETKPKQVKTIKVPNLKELCQIYEQKWIDDWYQNKNQQEKYFADGQAMLKQFYEKNQEQWTIPVVLEGAFKIKIGQFALIGRIDRIDQLSDGRLQIIDYKTGTSPGAIRYVAGPMLRCNKVSQEKAGGDDKEQLTIYQLAVDSLPAYNHLGKIGQLTLYYLKDNQIVNWLASEQEIDKIKKKLIATVKQISSGDFTATPNKHICANCHYRDICEFRL